MRNIAIILSSYNGDKYLSEQIESIINQTSKNWNLFIRDDGSTDSTLSIINFYQEKDSRIKLIHDNLGNVGPLKSFEALMRQVENYDFIFFCDQDDIWKKHKIEISMSKILGMKNEYRLVYTNFENFGTQEMTSGKFYPDTFQPNHKNLLIQNWIYGCTMVINNKLLNITKEIPIEAINHDNWIVNVAQIYGDIEYLDDVTVLHRIHENNVTTSNTNPSLRRFKYLNKIILKKRENKFVLLKFLQKLVDIHLTVPTDKEYIYTFLSVLENNRFSKIYVLIKNKYYAYSTMRTLLFYFTIL